MIRLTEKAASEIRRLSEVEKATTARVRARVVGGGCSGMSYQIQFDGSEPKEGDKVFEQSGVTVVVDAKSFLFLTGTELDFSDGLNGKGFVFNNPNAKRTCGCGSSFST